MNRSVIRASALAGIAAACAMVGTAHAELTVQLGTVQQVAPRPSLVYTCSYGAFVTSHLDASGTRTVTSFDLHGIAQQLAHSFPDEQWGQKAAGPGRPVSSDTIARKMPEIDEVVPGLTLEGVRLFLVEGVG